MLDSLEIKDTIFDSKLESLNLLCTISIRDYLEIANNIKNNNEFQRRKVLSRSTVYSLLKDDLKDGCIIPAIVLAIDEDGGGKVSMETPNAALLEKVRAKSAKLKILDGLQRTNILLDLAKELNNLIDGPKYSEFLNRRIRLDIYIGISRFGILYRMLTLNTGQTQMSLRHQIEILYSDLFSNNFQGIALYRDAIDFGQKAVYGHYLFSDIVEGVTSYIEGSEFTLDRFDLLDYIKTLRKLSKENVHQDLFQSYLSFYHRMLGAIAQGSNDWSYDEHEMLQEQLELIQFNTNRKDSYIFGWNAIEIFTRPQIFTALGAALNSLKRRGVFTDDIPFLEKGEQIVFSESVSFSFNNLIVRLAQIRKNAKKIGDEQRTYFKYFFESFLDKREKENYLNFDNSVDLAYKKLFSSEV